MSTYSCPSYCFSELGDYSAQLDVCTSKGIVAGVSNIVLLECGATLADPENGTEVNALISAGMAKLITGIKLGLGDPSQNTAPSITSCGSDLTVSEDRTFEAEDYKVNKAVAAFWNQANGRLFGGAILQKCEADGEDAMCYFIDSPIQLRTVLKSSNTNKELVSYNIGGKWTAKDNPDVINTPTGVFD